MCKIYGQYYYTDCGHILPASQAPVADRRICWRCPAGYYGPFSVSTCALGVTVSLDSKPPMWRIYHRVCCWCEVRMWEEYYQSWA